MLERQDSTEIAHEAARLASCFRCDPTQMGGSLDSDRLCAPGTGSYALGSLGMNGSYPLTHAAIDELMTRTSPGNYALGYMDDATFVVFYVGRSDSDVRRRLHRWVGAPSRYARYAPSTRAAWGSHRVGILPLDSPVLDRVEACADSSYTHFAYSYAPSAEAAFEKERRNFEDLGGSDALDNETEPISAGGQGRHPR